MFDTNIVIIGNVLTAPEWRRTPDGTLVANFRVASTSRRIDRTTGQWIDGNSLRVRVTCWRRLAEGIGASLAVGDPVIVTGRIFTRDWVDTDNNPRVSYEMEAVAVGHDLARGKGRFYRRSTQPTGAVEDEQADNSVRGEAAAPVDDEDVPVTFGDGVPDGDEPAFAEQPLPGADAGPGSDSGLQAEVEATAAEPGRRGRRARREPVPA